MALNDWFGANIISDGSGPDDDTAETPAQLTVVAFERKLRIIRTFLPVLLVYVGFDVPLIT